MAGRGSKRLVEIELVYEKDGPASYIVKNPNYKKGMRQALVAKEEILFLPMSIVKRDGHIFTMPEWLAVEKGIENLIRE